MTPKQRTKTAFARQQPDRVPMHYYANPEIDERLKAHFGLAKDDDEGLRQQLGSDMRWIFVPYVGPKRHGELPGMAVDEWGVRRKWIQHGSGGYWDYCDWPLQNATLEEVDAWPMPTVDDYDYSALAARCRSFSDYYVVTGSGGLGDMINSIGMLRTMEQILVDLITDDPAGLRLMDRKVEIELAVWRRVLEACNGAIDMLQLGEDLGTQRGPTISLDLFRRHIRPRMQKFVDLGREFGATVMIHSCGSSSWAFDDFAEMGIEVVDTLQPEAQDMAPAYLKKRFGDRLSFHGCISTAGALTYGSVDDVVRDVRATLDVMMPGGGYCLAPTHMIQSNSPVENVVAMFETAKKHGRY